MKVFVLMPTEAKFKPGDAVLERGFSISSVDEAGKATTEEINTARLFRPASAELLPGTDPTKTSELSAKLKALAEEIESL